MYKQNSFKAFAPEILSVYQVYPKEKCVPLLIDVDIRIDTSSFSQATKL